MPQILMRGWGAMAVGLLLKTIAVVLKPAGAWMNFTALLWLSDLTSTSIAAFLLPHLMNLTRPTCTGCSFPNFNILIQMVQPLFIYSTIPYSVKSSLLNSIIIIPKIIRRNGYFLCTPGNSADTYYPVFGLIMGTPCFKNFYLNRLH